MCSNMNCIGNSQNTWLDFNRHPQGNQKSGRGQQTSALTENSLAQKSPFSKLAT